MVMTYQRMYILQEHEILNDNKEIFTFYRIFPIKIFCNNCVLFHNTNWDYSCIRESGGMSLHRQKSSACYKTSRRSHLLLFCQFHIHVHVCSKRYILKIPKAIHWGNVNISIRSEWLFNTIAHITRSVV